MRTPGARPRGSDHPGPGPVRRLLLRLLQGPRCQGRYRTHPPGGLPAGGNSREPPPETESRHPVGRRGNRRLPYLCRRPRGPQGLHALRPAYRHDEGSSQGTGLAERSPAPRRSPRNEAAQGHPTTPPWITLVDLGSVAPAAEVRSALDQALFLGIVSLPQMRWALATFGRDRHHGTAVLRSLLAERDPGYAPPESEGEALFYALIEGSDLPPGVRQFPIWDGKRWRRLDYAWPNPGVGAEFDGWTTHGTREAFQDDHAPRRPSRRRIIKDTALIDP